MDKGSLKLVFFVALLVASAGVQLGVEAVNLWQPGLCTTPKDCDNPAKCKCSAAGLCVCPKEVVKVTSAAPSAYSEEHKETPESKVFNSHII
ncbi:hypothetical protein DVH24_033799 [Malus domestica]|uniref:Uncharacterized protein n=1 Tax=Malus domestica TaxID=3750 RepID=A0A498HSZ0_MALDO|nr:hypothetical protein DVH24_033799 [Malus domestica]